ncbi:hypothetical protein, partial [Helicobacter apodemus]|uniref:hypothetical protein n=1 Tax=Helicobacter apodemus TaxID=135569 RepID=UPI001884290A
ASNLGTLENKGNLATLTNTGTLNSASNTGTIANLDNTKNIGTFSNAGTIISVQNTGVIANLDNVGTITGVFENKAGATIANLNNSGSIGTLSNEGNLITFKNSGKSIIFNNSDKGQVDEFINSGDITINNKGTISNLDLNGENTTTITNEGTISNLGFSGKNTATITNQSKIGLLKVTDNTKLTYYTKNVGSIENLEVSKDSLLEGEIDISSVSGNVINHGSVHGTLINNDTIVNFVNTSMHTVNKFVNKAGNIVKTLNNTGRIIEIENAGTINNYDNTGVMTTFNNSGNVYKFSNRGTLNTFIQTNGSATIDNTGTINTINANGGNLNLTNKRAIDKLDNKATLDLYNTGIITDFNNDGGQASIFNAGVFEKGITNTKGTLSYSSSWSGNVADRKIRWASNASNADKFHFKNEDGVIRILSNNKGNGSVGVNINKNNADYNNISNATAIFNSPIDEYIILAGKKAEAISFEGNSIRINPRSNFSFGKDYKLDSLVVKNDSGSLTAFGKQVNNGKGITLSNLTPSESFYEIETGSSPDTFKIGIEPSNSSGVVAAQTTLDVFARKNVSDSIIGNPNFIRSLQVDPAKKQEIYFFPYFTSSGITLKNGTVGGSNKGFVTGGSYLTSFGLLEGFISYDKSNAQFKHSNTTDFNLRFLTDSYYGSARIIKKLGGTDTQSLYLTTQTKGSFGKNTISNDRGEGQVRSYSYAANGNLTAEFFADDPQQSLKITLGGGYEGSFIEGFSMNYDPNIFYKSSLINFGYVNTAVGIDKTFNGIFTASVE